MSIIPMRQNDRRRIGRPRNTNKLPNDAHLACRHEDIDELDRLISGFSRMPLGVKFHYLIEEYKRQKNQVGQQVNHTSGLQTTLMANNVNNVNVIESLEDREQRWREEIAELNKVAIAKIKARKAETEQEFDSDETQEEPTEGENEDIAQDEDDIPTDE